MPNPTASVNEPVTGEMARHIAQAAARLFAGRGYDATSVREIVAAAGVAKPTLYYHFGSKEGLAHALLTMPMRGLVLGMRSILESSDDPVRKLERMVEVQFEFCREDPDRARFVYALFFGPLGSGLSAELAGFGEVLAAQLEAAVQQAANAGRIDLERAPSCMAALRGLVVIHTMDFLYRGHDLAPELAGRIVVDLLRGFGPPAAALKTRGRAHAARESAETC
ncbi:MAG TPA: TetR/AcrR family transcriptional regulator [Isosphaeraceae bacterium]|nr:TetR/AcrR family transcriptional regulator [Isosphaeraceae bacterium]